MYVDKGIDGQRLQFAAHEAAEISRRDRLNMYITLEPRGFLVQGEDAQTSIKLGEYVTYEAAKSHVSNELMRVLEQVAYKLRTARMEYNRTRAMQ